MIEDIMTIAYLIVKVLQADLQDLSLDIKLYFLLLSLLEFTVNCVT